MATYKHLRSSTANKRPTTSITDGQLAINTNTASPGLFFKDSAGTGIVKVGPVHVGTTAPNATPAAGGSSGNYLGEQWLDTSVSPAQMKVWNGSAWVGIVADELPVSKLQDGDARQLLQTDAAGTGVEWTSNVDVPGTLDVTSTATFDSIARHPLGSAAAPTLTFTGDPNTGIYSPGADQVAVATNGTGRLFVNASGNVGIGNTTGLGGTLGVSGNISLSGNGTGTRYLGLINETDTYAGSFALQAGGGSSGFGGAITMYGHSHATYPGSVYIGTSAVSGGSIILGTNNALDPANEKVRITPAGFLGIGTSSPNNKFTLQDGNVLVRSEVTTGTSNLYHIGFSATSTGGVAATIGSYRENANEASALTFNTWNGSAFGERVRLDSSGRLLVGTSSVIAASPLLQVEQTTGAEIALGRQDTSVILDDLMGGIGFWGRDTSGVAYTEQSSIKCFADGTHDPGTNPTRLVFSTTAGGASSPTQRMTIKSSGIINFSNAPVYADNAAALAGGLVAGDVYRKADGTLMITF
jgi:hypothetical protein